MAIRNIVKVQHLHPIVHNSCAAQMPLFMK